MLNAPIVFAGLAILITACGVPETRLSDSCASLAKERDSVIVAAAVRDARLDTSGLVDLSVKRAEADSAGDSIIAISWEAPGASLLLWAPCSGRLSRVAELPRIDSLRRADVQNRRLVAAWYTETGATSYLSRGVVVYSAQTTVREVWSASWYSVADSAGVTRTDSASVSFGNEGITRTRWSTGVGAHPLATEHYLWSAKSGTFISEVQRDRDR